MRVLIIEDDQRLAQLIHRVLTGERMHVDIASDGVVGLDMAFSGSYDVAVIDWMLPERDGLSICRALRKARVATALLMLTARGQVEDRVQGLENGADDYLIKPFAFEELVARIHALYRRVSQPSDYSQELRHGNIVLDVRTHTARRGDMSLQLTATEWNLLEFLLQHPGQIVSRDQILNRVWADEYDVQPSIVEVYISYLRRKLAAPGYTDPIRTVRGFGYRLVCDDV